jgi:hypothetical protein
MLISQCEPKHRSSFAALAKPMTSHRFAVASLLLRCYYGVLFAVISFLHFDISQGLCGEPDVAG